MTRPEDRNSLIVTLFALAALVLTLWTPAVLSDGDSWWHLAAGQLMIARHTVLTTDPFSYTLAGAPWFTHEWLAEVLFAGAFQIGGWAGVVGLTGLAFAATAGLLAAHTGRWIRGLPQICLLVLALSLCAPHLLARPHVLAWLILELWAAELIIAREEDRQPRWRFLPLMALWANLHGGFLFGLALIGPFALEALVSAPRAGRSRVILGWGGFGLAATAMTLLTPHGVEGLLFPIRLLMMPSLPGIGEWAPADFATVGPLALALVAVLYVLLTRPVRLSSLRALLLLALLVLSLQHNRHEQMLGLIGALVLAEPLAKAFGQSPATTGQSARVLVGAAAVTVAILAARIALPIAIVDTPTTPVRALAAVPGPLQCTPVLNDYRYGGYLIGQGVKPYVDGRADLYGERFLGTYARMADGDVATLNAELLARKIRWSLLAADSPLAAAMDRQPGWRRLYADRWAVVHVRTAADVP